MKPDVPTESVRLEIEHTMLTLHMPPDMLAAVDAYNADANGHPDRPSLLLRIIRDWLNTNGYLGSDPTGDDRTV